MGKATTKIISLRLSLELIAKLESYAGQRQMTISEVLKEMIEQRMHGIETLGNTSVPRLPTAQELAKDRSAERIGMSDTAAANAARNYPDDAGVQDAVASRALAALIQRYINWPDAEIPPIYSENALAANNIIPFGFLQAIGGMTIEQCRDADELDELSPDFVQANYGHAFDGETLFKIVD